jgi:penicillin-binding protein 2
MQNPYSDRKYTIGIIILAVVLIYSVRLFYIQIIDKSYKLSADNNSQRHVTMYPARGLIYDRNGKLLVYNEAAYDLMVDPPQLRPFDTLELARILNLQVEDVRAGIEVAKKYSRYKPSQFIKQVSAETYAELQEKLFHFPGFFVQPRTLRKYEHPFAAHLFGYVGEVDSSVIQRDGYYQMGDYYGISGIEKTYEQYLRGKKGISILLVDVHNRVKGSYQDGKYDTIAVSGTNLYSTIDERLQAYGEKLMQNKKGSIVAIEPSTGEVLCLVSSPGYDPGLLVGRVRAHNYRKLLVDPNKPLFNRALMAKYPPGSTFKLINALIGLQEGVITPSSQFGCNMGYTANGIHLGCHRHASPLDLRQSIQHSCNGYYCNVFRRIIEDPKYHGTRTAFNNWRKYVLSFGYGRKLETDFANELAGNVPTSDYYDRYFGVGHWYAMSIISLSIGQAELGTTPLQLANLGCIIANKGYYVTPHVIKRIDGVDHIDSKFTQKHFTGIDTSYYTVVGDGMEMAVRAGTAHSAFMPNYVVCGKTGTAENPQGRDHSIFMSFAPRNNPKIAISVYVENAGFGAAYAVPIGSLMVEKYLTDTITRPDLENNMVSANLMDPGKPTKKKKKTF